MYKWQCRFSDNSGKKQFFKVSASDKAEAIKKAFKRAKKHAAGDLSPRWEVSLIRTF